MLRSTGLGFGVPSEAIREIVKSWILARGVRTHDQGRVILSPPGSGKSYFVERHPEFVDIDEFLGDGFLRFHTEDWTREQHTEDEERVHYEKCDVYLAAMREAGLWVVGSLFWDYLPDAIVIIDEQRHRSYVDRRKDLSWKHADQVRSFLLSLSKKHPEIQVFSEWDPVAIPISTMRAL